VIVSLIRRRTGSGTGKYLPVMAVLDGLLFVWVEGYREALRDVIRLGPSITRIMAQQGYIRCEPLDAPRGTGLPHQTLHCSLLVIPSQVCRTPALQHQLIDSFYQRNELSVPSTNRILSLFLVQ
jgi:hypothetical protein